jgi:hypothetical protein
MIQVQNGRFLFNWIGVHGDPYPRYERVREQFIENFESFREFLSREQLGSLAPNQWEVTYLNHIPRDSVWANVRGWTFFRPVNVVEGIPRLTSLESLAGEWHYVIEPKRGRLHVQWQHGRRNGQELIVLNLTSRGPIGKCPGESPLPRILEGLDLGREVIVRSFGSLMDDRANKYWGLHDETH